MKFSYEYKTRDNERRTGTIIAASKDEVYRKLKAEGVHPFNVTIAPGVFNKVLSIGKRGFAIVTLVLVSVVLAVALGRARSGVGKPPPVQTSDRHQIYGDPSILAGMESDAYAGVFSHPGERFLAFYAQPGRAVRMPESLSVRYSAVETLPACLTNEIVFAEGESRETVELKRIVNGMKDELREYLAEAGVVGFLRCLDARQREEQTIYERASRELMGSKDDALWNTRNAQLRELGLRTVEKPAQNGR